MGDHEANLILGSFYEQMAVYAVIAFILVILALCLIHFLCLKRFRLNWYEKMTLDNAKHVHQSAQDLISADTDIVKGSTISVSGTSVRSQLLRDDNLSYETDSGQAKGSQLGSPTSESSFAAIFAPSSPDSQKMMMTRSEKEIVLSTITPAWPKITSMQSKLDHTQFDASLYNSEVGGGGGGEGDSVSADVRGLLHLSLQYDSVSSLLTVHLIEANDIQPREFSGTADPYAKIRLLPNKEHILQTIIHKKTLNPVFDEHFVFELAPSDLATSVLEVLLCDFDAFSRHHYIGSLQLPLRQVDLSESGSMWRTLAPCVPCDANLDLGELMVSMSYLPSAGRLTVVVVKARNLKIVDETRSTSDPFVKVSLIIGQKRAKKRKTTIQRNNLCPVFNEAVTFDIKRDMLKKCSIEFCVFHDNLIGGKEIMGSIIIGNSPASSHEDKLFFNDIPKTKSAVAKWFRLKDNSV